MSGELPCLGLHPRDVMAIDQAVKGYVGYLRKGVPPSQSRDMLITILQNMRLRLANVGQRPNTDIYLPLTSADIQALQEALTGFVRLVRQRVPYTQEREDILFALEQVSQRLGATFS